MAVLDEPPKLGFSVKNTSGLCKLKSFLEILHLGVQVPQKRGALCRFSELEIAETMFWRVYTSVMGLIGTNNGAFR